MSKRNTRGAWSLGVLGVVVLTALPLVGEAEDTREEQGRLLEARLPRGEPRDIYPGLLSDLGYTIVAIHEPGPDVAAYEVRQGTQASLIQFEIDPTTQTAVEIAVLAPSLGTRVIERAGPSTDLALWSGAEGSLPEARAVQAIAEERDTGGVRGVLCSERDQHRAAQLVQEIEALPSGYDLAFYPGVLVRQGYQVRDQESGAEEERTFEASKDGQTLAVRVRLDEQTGESVSIEASPLWQEATGSSLGQREAVAAEPRGERAEVEAKPQEHVVAELSPGEIPPEPLANEELMESEVVDAGEVQAEDTEQPAGPQLGMQEERTDPAGGAVVSVPEQPQVASATESQPEMRNNEKTEDTRSVLHDPTGD